MQPRPEQPHQRDPRREEGGLPQGPVQARGPARARRQRAVPEAVGGGEAEQQGAARAVRREHARAEGEHEGDVRCADQGAF